MRPLAVTDLLGKRAREVAQGLCAEAPSPCISICRIDPVTELCEGCFRSRDEIARWRRMEKDDKREVWEAIEQRISLRQAQCERNSG
jgi:predicted Fe-S protein YdhL (DUF1289 family)